MFILNQQLEKDSFFITNINLSQLRLMNDANYIWLILIPQENNLKEFIDLSFSQQIVLLQEINLLSAILKQNFPCDKINIANLGNIVPQLHIHIIARKQNDITFPKPVWGNAEKIPYSSENLKDICEKIKLFLQNHEKDLDKKITYRSLHRGCKETDFLLGKFTYQGNDKNTYLSFLSEDDMMIYDWILNKSEIPTIYQKIIEDIRNFHKII